MADDADKASKTEEASAHQIQKAVEKGNTPFSREPGHIAVLLAAGLALPLAAAVMLGGLVPALLFLLDRAGEVRLETPQDATALFWAMSGTVALAVLPLLAAVGLAGLLAGLVQYPPRLALQRIKPQLSKLSIVKGATRLFGADGRAEFLKACAKLIFSGLVVYWQMMQAPDRILWLGDLDPSDLGHAVVDEISRLFLTMAILLIALAGLDLVWTRVKWRRDLRMTPQEVKDEHKQMEGDPLVRSRQRSIARNRARKRMISAVPRATLVVANPTHYAVALRYVHGETAAPVVVAKGVDHLALRIRAIAEAHGIAVVEDRELARTLHAVARSDRPIPPEFYRAVAEIILHLMAKPGRPWAA